MNTLDLNKTDAIEAETERAVSEMMTPERMSARKFPRIGIRFIVTAAAVGITTFAVLIVGGAQERSARQALTNEIEARLLLDARNLAITSSDALLTDFPELTLHPLLKEMQERQPELALAVVVNHEGIIQGHADSRELGNQFTILNRLTREESRRELAPGEVMLGNKRMLVASAPVEHRNGERIGTAAVGMERSYIDDIIARARMQQILTLSVVLLLCIVAALLLMTFLMRPIGLLRAGLERIGRGDLDSPIKLRDRTELGMLADTVNDMSSKLKTAREEMVEKERMKHELDLAREIQMSLLPKSKTVSEGFLIAGSQQVASEVGGDYYDIFTLPNQKVGVAVADVSGKGLAGCLVMSMLSALLGAFRERHDSPSALLIALDEQLSEYLKPGTFVTMFYGILDPRTGKLVFASAGHSPGFVYRKSTGVIERYPTRGIPLGAIRGGVIGSTLKDDEVVLDMGDMLVQYTDGINEAFDSTGEKQFDFERMEKIITSGGPKGGEEVLDGLRLGVEKWRGDGARLDDETLLVVSREIDAPMRPQVPLQRGPAEEGFSDPLARLNEAKKRGEELVLEADLERLDLLTGWLQSRSQLQMLERKRMEQVKTAVYEACANIVEHGYGQDPQRQLRVWWVPDRRTGSPERRRTAGMDASGLAGDAAGARGYFLILDQGEPFSADNWVATDFTDRKVWRQSRGFGLDIIHGAMSHVRYSPSTPEGNITLLAFNYSNEVVEERALRHEQGI